MRFDSPVLLYGAGREGRSTRAFLKARAPDIKVFVTVDSGTPDIEDAEFLPPTELQAAIDNKAFGTIVSGFWPMRSEVDVRPMMFALREQGARLCLPAILDKTTIVFQNVPADGAKVVVLKFNDFQCPGCKEGWSYFTPILEEFARTNPGAVKYVMKDYPPTILVHGTEDTDVPYELSANMAKEFEKHKVPFEFVTVKGAGHGLSGADPKAVKAAHEKVLAFIRAKLK